MCEEWCGRLQVGHKAWPHAPSNNRLVWCHMQLANLVAYDRRCEIRWANVLIYFISSWKLLGSLHNPLPHPQLAWLSSSFGWSHQSPAMTRKWDESETNNLVFNMARMKLPKADVSFQGVAHVAIEWCLWTLKACRLSSSLCCLQFGFLGKWRTNLSATQGMDRLGLLSYSAEFYQKSEPF